MKTLLFVILAILAFLFGGCSSSHEPPGPVQRAGAAVDNAVYNTGGAIKRTGQRIQNAVD